MREFEFLQLSGLAALDAAYLYTVLKPADHDHLEVQPGLLRGQASHDASQMMTTCDDIFSPRFVSLEKCRNFSGTRQYT